MRIWPAFFLMLLPACGDLPKDPEGTLERIREERAFGVGWIAGTQSEAGRLFLGRVARDAEARPRLEQGSAERLLTRLEHGQLDLVVGEFHVGTPWATRVTLIPQPKGKPSSGDTMVGAAARNGENGWISLLHRHEDVLKAGR